MSNHNLVERAMAIAVSAHEGQMRKEADVPYIVHPVSVALVLARNGFPDTFVAAALVHDVVEDTSVSLEELRSLLGDEVANIVAPVTHDDTLPWEEKKRAYIEEVRKASLGAKAISLADKISNAHSLLAAYKVQGSAIWKHFNAGREKKLWFERAMLDMYRETWEHPMVEEYALLVSEMDALE